MIINSQGGISGKLLRPAKRRREVERMRHVFHLSERRVYRAVGQPRTTSRYQPIMTHEETRLTARIIELASKYGRYGYRMITGLLKNEGWKVNHKRVERIWRQEGLKDPNKQPKRGRLWLNDGACIRLRPELKDHIGSYDFSVDRLSDGRAFRTLNIEVISVSRIPEEQASFAQEAR